jgi:hypothetical protein
MRAVYEVVRNGQSGTGIGRRQVDPEIGNRSERALEIRAKVWPPVKRTVRRRRSLVIDEVVRKTVQDCVDVVTVPSVDASAPHLLGELMLASVSQPLWYDHRRRDDAADASLYVLRPFATRVR